MSMLLLEIALLGAGIAIAVAAMVCDGWSMAREEARSAVHAADCLTLDQAAGRGAEGPRPPAHAPQPLTAWVDDAVLCALEEL